MFFLLPPFALILFVCFGVALLWRLGRQGRGRGAGGRGGGGGSRGGGRGGGQGGGRRRSRRRSRRQSSRAGLDSWPLVPAALLRGAERTWLVFTNPRSAEGRLLAEQLRTEEPGSQVTEVDARREPLLVEALRIDRLPAVVLADRYGQVVARLVGPKDLRTRRPSPRRG